MTDKSILDGKKILIVDDESDILEVLVELLPMCDATTAQSFSEAKEKLETEDFDIAILDIMGVDGYGLLKIANEKKVTAIMLTAHAFTPDNIVKSIKEGAASYVPKDEIANIQEFIIDALKSKSEGSNPWEPWQERLPSSYFERKFGAAWQNNNREFWQQFRNSMKSK